MDPSDADRANLTNLDLVAQWSGIDGTRDDATTVRGSLFALIGVHGAEPPRVVAVLPTDDVQATINTWRIPQPAGAPAIAPTLAQLGQVGIFFRTCRYLCGRLPEQIQAAIPMAAAAPAAGPSPRKVKMNNVINQLDDEEVENMDANAINAAYRAYVTQLGGFPPDDEELSNDQLTTLAALYKSGRAPYVDMSIWGPFQHRIQRKIKLKGVRFGARGELIAVEMFGPMDFESWRECYMVFRTGSIMLEQVTPAKLDAYEKIIRGFHDRYGKLCWPLIYQADVRARLEQSERVRRRGQQSYETARAAGLNHEFQPNMPWEWVWKELAADHQFWHKEITEPCLLYLSKTSNLTQLLDNDAPVSKPGQQAETTSSTPPTAPSRAASTSARPAKRQRGSDVREHRVGDDGQYTHNRRGIELCKLFQSGECTESTNGCCNRNPARRHQCSKCLSELHGSARCPMDGPRPPRQQHGKGGGKRGKGKK